MFFSTNWLHIYFYFKKILLEVEWFQLLVSYVNARQCGTKKKLKPDS